MRRYLWWIFALPALLLAAVLFALSRGGGLPVDGAPGGGRVFYPAVMLYNYAAIPVATTILLAVILLAVLWAPQRLRRLPRYQSNGLALALTGLAALLACAGSLPQLFVNYRHLDRAELGGRVYQLGVRLAADGDHYYVLSACDAAGWLCAPRRLDEAGRAAFEARPRLVADEADRSLSVEVGGQTLVTVRP
jgi:hypothetical protein